MVPQGEFQVNNHTFKVVIREDLNWSDAWEMCKKNNMDLASVADAYVQAVLTVNVSKLGSPLWIGLFSQDVSLQLTHAYMNMHHTMSVRTKRQLVTARALQ